MKLHKSLLLPISIILLGLTTGCSTLNYFEKGDVQTAIRITVVMYVDGHPEKANDVLKVIQKTRADLAIAQEITISKAAMFIRKNIVWNKLEPWQAIAVDALIVKVENAIDSEIQFSQIPPDKIVMVDTVLGWIEDAVVFAQKVNGNGEIE